MGPVSTVRPSVQWSATPPPSAGIGTGGAAGGRVEAAAAEPLRPAAQAQGAPRDDAARERPAADHGFAVESARARAMAAQRAYEMASLVAGLNPLNDPVG